MLTMLRKRKDNQYHYRSVQSTKKGNTDKKAERDTPVAGTITSFSNKQLAVGRAGDRACPPSHDPWAMTDMSAASAERPRYSEHHA
eukprot:9281716-Heterocapsa_arctica.AAC.1